MTETVDWDTYGYVTSSRYRIVVVARLADAAATPSTIGRDAEVLISHISRALSELQERGVVELLVPEDRKKGRLYGLTDEGEALADWLRESGHVEAVA